MLTVQHKKSEWIVSEEGTPRITVCADVVNGAVDQVKIIGISESPIYLTRLMLQTLWAAITPTLQAIQAAEERTKPREE